MHGIEEILINFYDAVIANDGMAVEKILADNLLAKAKLTIKMITGMLVIAIEGGLSSAGEAILTYNNLAEEKITDKNLDSIMHLAAKKSMLQSIGITLN